MGDLMQGFSKKGTVSKMNAAETVISCEERYMKLLRVYRTDIEEIENMMKALRTEREDFYLKQLPEIRKELEMDEVAPEIRAEWLTALQQNMEKSFQISEKLISHYVTKNLSEFEAKLQEAMGQV